MKMAHLQHPPRPLAPATPAVFQIILFLGAAAGTFVVFSCLAASDLTGTRGESIYGNPFHRHGQKEGHVWALGIVAGVVSLMTFFAVWCRLPRGLILGQWFALLLAGIMVLIE